MTREEQIIEKAGKESELFYNVNDNYGDCFHGGFIAGARWLAFPLDYWDIPDGVEGGDLDCMDFWYNYNGIVGKGSTPQEAMDNLIWEVNIKNEN